MNWCFKGYIQYSIRRVIILSMSVILLRKVGRSGVRSKLMRGSIRKLNAHRVCRFSVIKTSWLNSSGSEKMSVTFIIKNLNFLSTLWSRNFWAKSRASILIQCKYHLCALTQLPLKWAVVLKSTYSALRTLGIVVFCTQMLVVMWQDESSNNSNCLLCRYIRPISFNS